MEHGAAQIITSLLDEHGDRLEAFRGWAIRLATMVDQAAEGPIKIDASDTGVEISIEQAQAEGSVLVELLFPFSSPQPDQVEIKIYREMTEGFKEWHFNDPEEATTHLISLLEHRHPVNP